MITEEVTKAAVFALFVMTGAIYLISIATLPSLALWPMWTIVVLSALSIGATLLYAISWRLRMAGFPRASLHAPITAIVAVMLLTVSIILN